MDAILIASERMSALINDLLDAASIESGLFKLLLDPVLDPRLFVESVALLAPSRRRRPSRSAPSSPTGWSPSVIAHGCSRSSPT